MEGTGNRKKSDRKNNERGKRNMDTSMLRKTEKQRIRMLFCLTCVGRAGPFLQGLFEGFLVCRCVCMCARMFVYVCMCVCGLCGVCILI